MARQPKLTARRVREVVDCDPTTGILKWKERPGKPDFNAQWAGRQAGAVDPSTGYLRLMIDGKQRERQWIYLGSYRDPEAAERAYREERLRHCRVSSRWAGY
jgi:hypothetical protein